MNANSIHTNMYNPVQNRACMDHWSRQRAAKRLSSSPASYHPHLMQFREEVRGDNSASDATYGYLSLHRQPQALNGLFFGYPPEATNGKTVEDPMDSLVVGTETEKKEPSNISLRLSGSRHRRTNNLDFGSSSSAPPHPLSSPSIVSQHLTGSRHRRMNNMDIPSSNSTPAQTPSCRPTSLSGSRHRRTNNMDFSFFVAPPDASSSSSSSSCPVTTVSTASHPSDGVGETTTIIIPRRHHRRTNNIDFATVLPRLVAAKPTTEQLALY